jgi:hypothetical protein
VSNDLFDIVFRGDILPGHQLVEVKQRLAQLFKADEARINALFAGGAVPLKRNLDRAAAEKYQAVLRKAGADVQVSPAGSVKTKKPPQRPVRASASVVDKPVEAKTVKAKPVEPKPVEPKPVEPKPVESRPMTMQERLAATEKELAEKDAKRAGRGGDQGEEVIDPETGWSIAAVGADVLKPEERHQVEAVEVDVSAISVREASGDLVDASERPVVEAVVVDVSDISVAEAGADLLREEDKPDIPLLQVEVDDFGLAPAGSDMGQIKPPPPPPEPDTSGISLE